MPKREKKIVARFCRNFAVMAVIVVLFPVSHPVSLISWEVDDNAVQELRQDMLLLRKIEALGGQFTIRLS